MHGLESGIPAPDSPTVSLVYGGSRPNIGGTKQQTGRTMRCSAKCNCQDMDGCMARRLDGFSPIPIIRPLRIQRIMNEFLILYKRGGMQFRIHRGTDRSHRKGRNFYRETKRNVMYWCYLLLANTTEGFKRRWLGMMNQIFLYLCQQTSMRTHLRKM